jgi:hypothetical protein
VWKKDLGFFETPVNFCQTSRRHIPEHNWRHREHAAVRQDILNDMQHNF